jgi:hypothetical protein
MIDEKRAELARLSAQNERKNKVEYMLKSLHAKEADLSRQEQILKSALIKEEADVKRLQKTTAASILYSMLGKIDDKLNKEQQEAFAAKLKYDAVARELDDCWTRINELQGEQASLSDCAGQFDRVFAELQELLRADPAYAGRICELERQRGLAAGQIKELDEAISAGNAAMGHIEAVESSLGSAEGWGTWDLLGGGLISDMAKHSKLDEAQAAAEDLQVSLSRFHTELADVRIDAHMQAVNVDGFLRFADYFFDGLIADWSVLSRIHASQESVLQVRRQVGDALMKLAGLKKARAAEKAALDQLIADLVANA